MKVFRIAAAIAMLAGPAYAQGLPPINLIQDGAAKTPEQKAAEEARDKAYRESLKKIPDAKPSSDPWGAVRSGCDQNFRCQDHYFQELCFEDA